MNAPLIALQKAAYETLNNDATLSALISGVYNFVPEGVNYPYIVIEIGNIKDWSTISTVGYEVSLDVNAYSNKNGSKEILEISNRVNELLNQANITLDGGHYLIDIRYVEEQIQRNQNGSTYLASNNFVALIDA